MSDGMDYDVDVSGLLRALDSLGDLDLDEAIMAGGLVVEAHMKHNIISVDFIDTGATLNSVAAAKSGGNEVEIGPATDYAIFGELGIGQSEKRFARNALEQNGREIMSAMADELRAQLRRKGM